VVEPYLSEKYESQLGPLFPIQYMESHKIPWFQTTKQMIIYKSPTISNITLENHIKSIKITIFSMGNPRTKWRYL